MNSYRFFQRSDFEEFQTWFADETLNRELGPLDDEWLQAVLSEDPPTEFVFFRDNAMVAVVGITYPNDAYPEWFITSVAVKPELRGQGIGSSVLEQLQDALADQSSQPQTWIAYVDESNEAAFRFFKKCDWQTDGSIDSSGMIRFEMQTK